MTGEQVERIYLLGMRRRIQFRLSSGKVVSRTPSTTVHLISGSLSPRHLRALGTVTTGSTRRLETLAGSVCNLLSWNNV